MIEQTPDDARRLLGARGRGAVGEEFAPDDLPHDAFAITQRWPSTATMRPR